jgi:ATP-dependent RNA helicase DeaD
VLVPTRELGQQVAREFFLFSKYLDRVFAESVYGGVPIEDHIEKLKRRTQIVVATPGRLLDLLDRKALDLTHLKFVVIDEADEMIQMGFKSDIDQILSLCNADATKLLFTATLSVEISDIINNFLQKDLFEIRINAEEFVNQKIKHQYIICEPHKKLDFLKTYLGQRPTQRGILFCRTKTDAKRLAKQLAGFVVTADALHGNLNQEMRDKVMRGFSKNRIQLLVATDIAARGIDVKSLDYIIHYTLPENADSYVHRSGRTARAGKSGVSLCLLETDEIQTIKDIEDDLKISFEEVTIQVPNTPENKQWVKLYINLGFGQGFMKNNLPEFFVEEAGLSFSDIKNVVVSDNQSRFENPERLEEQLRLNLKGYKLAHRNVKITN